MYLHICQQPTFQQFTKQVVVVCPKHAISCVCVCVCVSSELLKCRLMNLLLDHPMQDACVLIFLCVAVSVCLSMSASVSICVSVSVSISISVSVSVSLFLCSLFLCFSVSLFLCFSVSLFVSMRNRALQGTAWKWVGCNNNDNNPFNNCNTNHDNNCNNDNNCNSDDNNCNCNCNNPGWKWVGHRLQTARRPGLCSPAPPCKSSWH